MEEWKSLIDPRDWEKTPSSVKGLLEEGFKRIKELEEQIEFLVGEQKLLREQMLRNSKNSSQPPSQDPAKGFKPKEKEKKGKKRGAQPGHQGHERKLYPPEQCQRIENHYPSTCGHCGQALSGEDPQPQRIQIVEIPPRTPVVEEHRFHLRQCPCCGSSTRAYKAEIVNSSGYGERLCALVGLLSGEYRQSHRMVERYLAEVWGIEMSIGSIQKLREQMSQALANPTLEALTYVQQQKVVGADETSFIQGNSDGNNPQAKRGWLWVLVTPWVCAFQILLSRSQAAAEQMLTPSFDGQLISDRYSAYNWVELGRRQVCWAHLKRDFTQLSERSGVSKELGQALLEQQERLFQLWYRVRDGTLPRVDFLIQIQPIRARLHQLLTEGSRLPLASGEKTPLAKTVRTCAQLLKLEPAFWLFASEPGVEPTNNAAERALRPAVLWRRCSLGSQSAAGSRFVERMLTVVTSLRLQQRPVLDYLTASVQAQRRGLPAPSLLPIYSA
jgi:transposase